MKGKHYTDLFRSKLYLGLKNTSILYGVSIVALLTLINFIYTNQINAIAIMLLSGFGTTFYSKNMIIILLVAIVSAITITPLISCITREGMDSTDGADAKKKVGDINVIGVSPDKKVDDSDKKDDINAVVPDEKVVNVSGTTQVLVEPKKPKLSDLSHPINKAISDKDKDKDKDKKQPFGQRDLVPAQYNSYGADTDDIDINSKHKPKIDYAATLEYAYDSLDKLLSSDAIKTMSDDTARLAEKQQQLMGNMTRIQPLIEKAGSVLDKMPNLGSMESMMESLKGKVSQFAKNV